MKLYVDHFIKIVGPNFGTNYRRNQTELGRPYGFCLMTGSISRPLKIVNPVALAALSMAISSLVRGSKFNHCSLVSWGKDPGLQKPPVFMIVTCHF